MAVSGSTDFNIDAAEVIQEAYERCGLQEVTGKDLRTAVRSMNLLFAEWANRGLNLWTVTLGTQSTTASDNDYSLATNIIDVLEVSLRDSNNIDQSLTRISRSDYHLLPNKSSEGKPAQFYFERTTTPTLFLYPTPDLSTYTVRYYFLKRIDDIDLPSDDPNVSFRFLPCLVAGLAYYIAMKKAPDRIQILKTVYDEEFERARQEDRDRASFSAVPGRAYFNNY
jgi:hypothetical protein|tara:strand:- start:1312 stop:1983 length:672 start_codon:yes stop_codon:yes gene_type:complete